MNSFAPLEEGHDSLYSRISFRQGKAKLPIDPAGPGVDTRDPRKILASGAILCDCRRSQRGDCTFLQQDWKIVSLLLAWSLHHFTLARFRECLSCLDVPADSLFSLLDFDIDIHPQRSFQGDHSSTPDQHNKVLTASFDYLSRIEPLQLIMSFRTAISLLRPQGARVSVLFSNR
jgi:hypothetical protein